MFKKLTIVVAVITLLAMFSFSVSAAKPATQACFGEDISSYAQNGETDPGSFFGFGPGVGWGGFISGVATSPGADENLGVGGEIQAHQAGFIPDTTISNTCN